MLWKNKRSFWLALPTYVFSGLRYSRMERSDVRYALQSLCLRSKACLQFPFSWNTGLACEIYLHCKNNALLTYKQYGNLTKHSFYIMISINYTWHSTWYYWWIIFHRFCWCKSMRSNEHELTYCTYTVHISVSIYYYIIQSISATHLLSADQYTRTCNFLRNLRRTRVIDLWFLQFQRWEMRLHTEACSRDLCQMPTTSAEFWEIPTVAVVFPLKSWIQHLFSLIVPTV